VCYNPTVLLRVGEWSVNPASGQISRDGETVRLEARTMRLLVCLAERAGQVVSIDDLIDQAWSGVTVSPDSVYQAVASLRRLLGDDPKKPTYIETVPRLGYRMMATVRPWDPSAIQGGSSSASYRLHPTVATSHVKTSSRRLGVGLMWAAGVALCLAVTLALLLIVKVRNNNQPTPSAVPPPLNSVAVLPFHDQTEGMAEASFADGMTADLIDKLSKIPGLRVHAPMPSSAVKGKRSTIADMAKMLGVAYVVDGSVRKSGSRLRVVARLIHAEDEYVVWSETYDRPLGDTLRVQDEIAGEVAKTLRGIHLLGQNGTGRESGDQRNRFNVPYRPAFAGPIFWSISLGQYTVA
jgi:transcriptional activator of cad operon